MNKELEELKEKINPNIEISDLDIEKAKLKFFSHCIMEEITSDTFSENSKNIDKIIKKVLDIESESDDDGEKDFINYILEKHNWNTILNSLKEDHYGDCTGCSCTCYRCYSEYFFDIKSISFSKHEGSKLLSRYMELKNEK